MSDFDDTLPPENHRRREGDSLIGQAKALWPVFLVIGSGYAAWEVQRVKLSETSVKVEKVVDDVSILKQTVAVQTAMMSEIRDTVKEIARGQRRRDDR